MARCDVYLETGQKRVFACALEWPGLCRSGRDAGTALQALVETAPRYQAIARAARLDFDAPLGPSDLHVVERLEGTATTDFGAPDVETSADARPLDETGLARLQDLLRACWAAFDQGLADAEGKTLRKGPRGGGRALDKIVEHVEGAEAAYLASLGGSQPARAGSAALRQAVLDGLAASARGEIPALGPRGGKRWSPRYFTRRAAWHVLDHLWEIEDRVE
jgi:hypothetical protein